MYVPKIRRVIPSKLFLVTACVALSHGTAVDAAGVVYGNLGSSGTNPLSATNTDYGGLEPVISLAQGFTTSSGTQSLMVGSVSLGLFNVDTPTARTVSIVPDDGGVPGASPLFTSAAVNVTTQGLYAFAFTNAQLAASTSYWIVPSAPGSWYLNLDESQPTAQNASGWAYLGTRRITTTSSGTWANASLPYSVSITAVPEPSAYAIALAGLACGSYSVWRRRRCT